MGKHPQWARLIPGVTFFHGVRQQQVLERGTPPVNFHFPKFTRIAGRIIGLNDIFQPP